jgi:hypothetical chaperone protein
MMAKPLAIGIDFGTSNTVVALLEKGGNTRVLELAPGKETLKSLLYFPSGREAFFGQDAIDQYFDRGMEGRFFQSVKRLLPNPDFTGTSLFGKHVSVEELIARFLASLRFKIEKEIGSDLSGIPVFFGRPARYSQDPPREALAVVRFRTAISLAGFDPDRFKLIEEPVAASRSGKSDGRTSKHAKEKGPLTLIADLGGGTSDFTLFESRPHGIHTFGVHGVSVAGDAIDSDFFVEKLQDRFGASLKYQRPFSSNVLTMPTALSKLLPKWHHHAFLKERATWNFILVLRKELTDPKQRPFLENLIALVEDNLGYRLHIAVEETKTTLSDSERTEFGFKIHPIEIAFPVDRPGFDSWIEPSVSGIEAAAIETCRLARIQPEEVELVRFTGGTSKVPAVRARIAKLFPNAEVDDQDTFTAVAEGLALEGESIQAVFKSNSTCSYSTIGVFTDRPDA